MKKYEKPEIEVISFMGTIATDVIKSSDNNVYIDDMTEKEEEQ